MFESILPGPPDVMYNLEVRAENDTSSAKVDLGVGIYRNNAGQYQELHVVKEVRYLKALRSLTRAQFGVPCRPRRFWRRMTLATM